MSVNLSLFAGAGWQFFTSNGVPLAGGLIYTYAAGTTTPQATYTSSTGGTAHANPIVLDSAGRVAAGEVWVSEGLNYKFVLKDSTFNTIGTYDNINGTYVAADLANTSDPTLGDALVGFRQSNASGNLTGTVGRTVHQKLQEIISVLDFGADSTGATSSTAAFQAALATNKTIYVPAGTYLITGALQLQDGQVVFGDGSSKTILNCSQTSFSGIFINMGGHTSLQSLALSGSGTAAATGVKCWDSSNQYGFTGYITIKDVNISGMLYGLYVNNIFMLDYEIGILTSNTYGVYIKPAYSVSYDSGYVTTNTFYKLYIYSNDHGVYGKPTVVSKNVVFRDCVIENNTTTYQAYLDTFNPLIFQNCYFEGSSTIPALQIVNCDTTVNDAYFNGTGGIDLGAGSNSFRGNHLYAVASTDKLLATGTSLQDVHLYNSQLGSATSLNASKTHLYLTSIGATQYLNFFRNLDLTLSGSAQGTNTTTISDVTAYTKTVTATINANTTTALISDQAATNIWASGFTTAMANLANTYAPGLILTVTPATTGSANFFCVLATNTTASNITITSATLKVLFFAGTGMAL